MIVLLDENFPLGLLRSLHNDGVSAQHIITLGGVASQTLASGSGFTVIRCCF